MSYTGECGAQVVRICKREAGEIVAYPTSARLPLAPLWSRCCVSYGTFLEATQGRASAPAWIDQLQASNWKGHALLG